jgi:hypothetical protein
MKLTIRECMMDDALRPVRPSPVRPAGNANVIPKSGGMLSPPSRRPNVERKDER